MGGASKSTREMDKRLGHLGTTLVSLPSGDKSKDEREEENDRAQTPVGRIFQSDDVTTTLRRDSCSKIGREAQRSLRIDTNPTSDL